VFVRSLGHLAGRLDSPGLPTADSPWEMLAHDDHTARPGQRKRLRCARLDLRRFGRRPGEVLLCTDVLGHWLIDVEAGA
jgi:hypothetical protein